MNTVLRCAKPLFILTVATLLVACDKPTIVLPENGLAKLKGNQKVPNKMIHSNEAPAAPKTP